MNVTIKIIPHNQQRYDSVGDWWWSDDENLEIRVSDLGNWKMEQLVAMHEYLEALICNKSGITEKKITAFDLKYEKDRKRGKYTLEQEPGDDPDAPYHIEHFCATTMERINCLLLGVNWDEYNQKVNSLVYDPKTDK